tara:strand:+ start:10085 stop:10681 length:597 start_codon:yes stop_codon:yes gene_type:complete
MSQLLIETNIWNANSMLTENVSKENGNLVVSGILATAEVKNGNGRYYSRELWERELAKYAEFVDGRRATGELDHPESSVINLKNVSHVITETWWQNDHVMGKIEILPTPSGQILGALIKAGVTVGVSSRGMGSLEQRGEVMEVQDDFELLCWDFVSTPSNPGSFMGVLAESKNPNLIDYRQVNNTIREILCSKGSCPM